MSSDLEDFLRRAAARRQQNEAAKKPAADGRPTQPPASPSQLERRPTQPASRTQPPPQRTRPEYTDARSERSVRPVEDPFEYPTGELVDALPLGHNRAAGEHRIGKSDPQPVTPQSANSQSSNQGSVAPVTDEGPKAHSSNAPTSKTIAELIQTLKTPDGIRSAILVREIIDRPEYRW